VTPASAARMTDLLFADRLRAVRQARGMTAANLSTAIGLGVNFVGTLERGRRKDCGIGYARELCRVLNVSLIAMTDTSIDLVSVLDSKFEGADR
jgi:transcriptional regulator with XRE-family HTH domain